MRILKILAIALVSASLLLSQTLAGQIGSKQATTQSIAAMPLASHPQGQQMMSEAAQKVALIEIDFKFLNKTYEDDKYVREPITGKKVRTACVRFRATSGFQFRMDVPKFTLTSQGLTIDQNISKLNADGLTVRFQLGPCVDVAGGVGLRLSDVRVVYKARPTLSFDENNYCKLNWDLDSDSIQISIGDLNILGVQNDIDKLAKDAVREALNSVLRGFLGSRLRSELTKLTVNVCGNVTVKTK